MWAQQVIGRLKELLKACLQGLLAGTLWAVAAAIAYVLAVFVLPLLLPFWWARLTGSQSDGAVAASFSTGPLVLVMLVAFAVGFCWNVRRVSRTGRQA